MSKLVKVAYVGASETVRGGISGLLRKVKNRFPENIQFRVIATYSDYIGDSLANRWARCVQPILFVWSVAQVVVAATTQHSTVFHVHFSQRGSTLRKGMITILLRVLGCRYIVQAHACQEDALFHEWVPTFVRRLLQIGRASCRERV